MLMAGDIHDDEVRRLEVRSVHNLVDGELQPVSRLPRPSASALLVRRQDDRTHANLRSATKLAFGT